MSQELSTQKNPGPFKQPDIENQRLSEARSWRRARPLFSRSFRWLFALANPEVRQSIARIPGVSSLYTHRLKPLLFPAALNQGFPQIAFPSFTMYVDPREATADMALGRAWEPATTYVFQQIVRRGDVIVDVGAHWGYFTLLAAALCGETGKVYAFEPHPGNFAWLTKNISANSLPHVVPVQLAVSDCAGQALLFEAQTSPRHSLNRLPENCTPEGQATPPLTVRTVTLDGFFSDQSIQPRLIKMDIEGSEPQALAGMRGLLKTGVIDDAQNRLEFVSTEQTLNWFTRLGPGSTINLLGTRDLETARRLVGAGGPARNRSRIQDARKK